MIIYHKQNHGMMKIFRKQNISRTLTVPQYQINTSPSPAALFLQIFTKCKTQTKSTQHFEEMVEKT